MRKEDFENYGIVHFTPEEVEGTGASLDDVDVELLVRYDKFRKLLKRRVVFAPNGLTTGRHSSSLHPRGKAGDCHFVEMDGPIDARTILEAGLGAGFHGIGIYWNGFAYSTHLDLRKEYGFWSGWKKHRQENWEYLPLITIHDPGLKS